MIKTKSNIDNLSGDHYLNYNATYSNDVTLMSHPIIIWIVVIQKCVNGWFIRWITIFCKIFQIQAIHVQSNHVHLDHHMVTCCVGIRPHEQWRNTPKTPCGSTESTSRDFNANTVITTVGSTHYVISSRWWPLMWMMMNDNWTHAFF